MSVNVLVVRLGFGLSPAVRAIDLPEGRIHLNHIPEVYKEKNEFVLIRQSEQGRFGIDLIPTVPLASGYKRADSLEKLGRLALEAKICETFKPRNFHAIVAEPLAERLNKTYNECAYGIYVELSDGSTVLVVAAEQLDGCLVEAVSAKNNVLIVRQPKFETKEPYRFETWSDFVQALLNEDSPRVRGKLIPRKPPKHLYGIWAGKPLDYINKRGQASCVYIIDGSDEGTTTNLFFTRVDETPEKPIQTGEAVEVWYTGNGNVAMKPYNGRVDRIIDPENGLVSELEISLPGRRPTSRGNIHVIYHNKKS